MIQTTHYFGTRHNIHILVSLITCLLFLTTYTTAQFTHSLHGGDSNSKQSSVSPDEVIQDFLQDCVSDEVEKSELRFHIQGWRWHTLSFLRDAGRLERLAKKAYGLDSCESSSTSLPASALDEAAEHVINFNLKGLHTVEDELFFPWLKDKLTTSSSAITSVARNAFGEVLKAIESDRRSVAKLAIQVREQARLASSDELDLERRQEAASNVAQMSSALKSRTQEILEREEKLLIPAVAALVPQSEQKSFNSKVIRKLGLLDSRLHLVGMYDAVMEVGKEEGLFNEVIPMIPRMMIPRWRRNLYEPKAGVLDAV